MGMFRAPRMPDPNALAAQQASMSRQTAVTQQELNMVDQVTPDGSLTYEQIGTTSSGTPRFRATTTLSPTAQRRFEQEAQIDDTANTIGLAQLRRAGDTLNTPFRLDNDATEARLFELGRKRLDPRFAEERAALDTELVNRGIRPGTEAYARATRSFNEGRNDAYNQLLLTGRGQAVQEALMERNQPLNETAALFGMGGVAQPQFQNTPQTGVQGVDYAGMVMDQARTRAAHNQALMGGLFGLAGAGTRAAFGRR